MAFLGFPVFPPLRPRTLGPTTSTLGPTGRSQSFHRATWHSCRLVRLVQGGDHTGNRYKLELDMGNPYINLNGLIR